MHRSSSTFSSYICNFIIIAIYSNIKPSGLHPKSLGVLLGSLKVLLVALEAAFARSIGIYGCSGYLPQVLQCSANKLPWHKPITIFPASKNTYKEQVSLDWFRITSRQTIICCQKVSVSTFESTCGTQTA